MIDILNPLIRGWRNYHKKVCARKTFKKLTMRFFKLYGVGQDEDIQIKVYVGLRRNTSRPIGNNNWCFMSKSKTKNKDTVELKELFKTTSILIRRHRKIRANANPFDKEWDEYFIERSLKYNIY